MSLHTSRREDGPYELIVFDLRVLRARRRFLSERAAWGEDATVELLDPDHAAMIVNAGGAFRVFERKAT
jgi:hypothetical protein